MSESDTNSLADYSKREIQKLKLIAEEGKREMVLWQLASDGRTFCGVEFVAREHGLEDDPLVDQVDAFVNDLEASWEDYAPHTDFERLEEKYGHIVDAIKARVG